MGAGGGNRGTNTTYKPRGATRVFYDNNVSGCAERKPMAVDGCRRGNLYSANKPLKWAETEALHASRKV